MSSQERYLTSPDGTTIWAEAVGNPSKPHIVFVHGLACTALGFDMQFSDPEMLENLYLVRYEMRGHGRSGKPEKLSDYDSLRYAEDFGTVCDAFGVIKPFVVGWSLGGCIPVDVVHYFGTDYISGVIYLGGGVLSRKWHPMCTHPVMRGMMPSLRSLDSTVASNISTHFIESCVANPPVDLPFPVLAQCLGGFVLQPPLVRRLTLDRQQDQSKWEKEAHVLPCLIIQGTVDSHCLYKIMIRKAREVYDDVDVMLMEGIGHAPHLEKTKDTNRFILDWVKKTVSQPKYAKSRL
ncbi:hypothetical protein CERSUDRAFT_159511 [Gelatoporia subvermispora B]|uniref:AB hydrolase-1 domain-containing protein n=1 Tax=Ceriporiopsis subvermispora (strain B) TaxID=914234 RepID=M2QPH8_CERS8|nr:hypothetical protein CERSUDRAFT_159511 [Gelatoporia subvermispora B]